MQNKKIKLLSITLFFIFILLINNKTSAYETVSSMSLEEFYSTLNSYYSYNNVKGLEGLNNYINDNGYSFSDFTGFYMGFYNSWRYDLTFYFFLPDSSISFDGQYIVISDFVFVNCTLSYGNFSNTLTVFHDDNVRRGVNGSYFSKCFCTDYFVAQNGAEILKNCEYINGQIFDLGYDPTVYATPTLYIDDMNLRKRFKFQFNIPMVREDTKYYVFLEDYNRVSYDEVNATFRIYTVTTPEGYDYTDYENYMYYDNLEKKLYLPAGCEIKEYSCTGTNGDLLGLTLEEEFVGDRKLKTYGSILSFNLMLSFLENIGFWDDSFDSLINNGLNPFEVLYPTNFEIKNFDSCNFYLVLLEIVNKPSKIFDTLGQLLSYGDYKNYNEAFFKMFVNFAYYHNSYINFLKDDLCFSNFNIVSYENVKEFSSESSLFYNFFRKTVYFNFNKNHINNNCFIFNYSDSEDVTSLLPQGTDTDYLTSPFYKDNEESSSGGYITYDIQEVLQGDKIIDYSKEDNSIHNEFNGDYIENFQEGDNIVINNYYTETIDKTSDENLLHNIYIAILEIRTILESMGDSISNTTNNFTQNTGDTINYYFKPNKYWHNYFNNKLKETAQEHLGFLYDPFVPFRYTFTAFARYSK